MDSQKLAKIAEAMTTGGGYDVMQLLRRRKGKGNKGQAVAKKARNRRRNRLARGNRRLNLRTGHTAGAQ